MSRLDRNTLAAKPTIGGSYTAANATDNTVVYTSGDISQFNIHTIEGVTANADVFVSLDGTTFTTNPIYLRDLYAASPDANYTPTVAANKVYMLVGKFKKIKIQNAGAAASTVKVLHGIG